MHALQVMAIVNAEALRQEIAAVKLMAQQQEKARQTIPRTEN